MILLSAIGHLGADAEVKTINEKEYITFRIASTEKRNGQEETTWLSVLTSTNDNLLPYLRKGQQVFVSGRLSAKIYQSQQSFGIDLSVFAQTLQLCGGKREEAQQQTPASPHVQSVAVSQQPTPAPFPPPVDENGNPKTEDDLPF